MTGNKTAHQCTHEKDWEDYHSFKDRVLIFIGAKEATNGALKEADNSLDGRLTRIEGKIDKTIWGFLLMAVGIIVALIK
jgi:hypothetical protein